MAIICYKKLIFYDDLQDINLSLININGNIGSEIHRISNKYAHNNEIIITTDVHNVHKSIDNYINMFGSDATFGILRSFLYDLDGPVIEMVAHINAGRFAEAAQGAHYLKSSAQSFEATRLCDALTRVRSLMSDASCAAELAYELQAAVEIVRQVVCQILESDRA